MNDAMQKLIDAIQKASPIVWQAAYRQVWIDGIEYVLIAALFFIGGRLLWKLAQRLSNEGADEAGVFASRLGAIGAWVLMLPFTVSALDCFLNPTFAAIRQLKGLL